jgi:cytochrome c oxidase subunit 1
MSAVIGHEHDHGPDHYPGGLMRWGKPTDHKDIGTMYRWFSFVIFLAGGFMASAVRAEEQQ